MSTLRSGIPFIFFLLSPPLIPLVAHNGNQFLSRAMEISAADVRMGTMAMDKSHNPDVQAFAKMLVADYNEALRKLIRLRAARTTVSATPATTDTAQSMWGAGRMRRTANDIPITADHQRTADWLSSLVDDEFDRRFVSEMVREHREAISLFAAQTHRPGNGALKTASHDAQTYSLEDLEKDLDTADFAKDILPTLRLHLERAEVLQRQLQKR